VAGANADRAVVRRRDGSSRDVAGKLIVVDRFEDKMGDAVGTLVGVHSESVRLDLCSVRVKRAAWEPSPDRAYPPSIIPPYLSPKECSPLFYHSSVSFPEGVWPRFVSRRRIEYGHRFFVAFATIVLLGSEESGSIVGGQLLWYSIRLHSAFIAESGNRTCPQDTD
jgi:hypothetical protein